MHTTALFVVVFTVLFNGNTGLCGVLCWILLFHQLLTPINMVTPYFFIEFHFWIKSRHAKLKSACNLMFVCILCYRICPMTSVKRLLKINRNCMVIQV